MRGIGRRAAVRGRVGAGLGGLLATGAAPAVAEPGVVPTADEGLRLLLEGNRRWQAARPDHPHEGAGIRRSLVAAQHPFATILSCVDSRVPPELVFDQGLGDLFTVRTAGEVLDDAVLGSIAFGAGELRIPLVVVVGHSSCGAVGVALDAVDAGEEGAGHLRYLVEAIRPAVPPQGPDRAARVAAAVDDNVRRVVHMLRYDSDLHESVEQGGLTVVGARYDLDSGAVTLL
ncbi:carbonic anhydrase [Pseudonocardia xishanensis]|uniref:Carbonic anhydrase n=1 Tax=Pseudonocardia xishanensis TaxID=630995 RepID=A0ABP8S0E2_9PSEU